jgi:hypothetical protein
MCWTAVCGAVLAGLGLLACWAQTVEGPRAAPAPFAVAANTFRSQFSPGEAVLAVAATGYAGQQDVWVTQCYGVALLDGGGELVRPTGPVDEPKPPPAEEMMHLDGDVVHVVPVWHLETGEAIATTASHGLERYAPLEPGSYTLVVVSEVNTFSEDSVIVRDDPGLPCRTWVRPEQRASSLRLRSNPVVIAIR